MLTESDCPDYAELIIAEEVNRKGEPVIGKRYLWFNIFMVVFLSIWVTIYDFKVVDLEDKKPVLHENINNNTIVKN
jgi:hypothetical protein